MARADAAFCFSDPAHLVALGFGAGLAPRAPGTVGTLVGFPLHASLALWLSPPMETLALAALFYLGIVVCGKTGEALGAHDHGAIVWDEVVAFTLVLVWAPRGLVWIAAAFVLFRLFDILKPWPIRVIDTGVKGGLGVMLDDLAAAGFTLVVLHLVQRFA
jgi:phosphatidylglycerophosphatase A